MGQSISAVLGAFVFAAFVFGLSLSINAVPFYIIVVSVIAMIAFEVVQDIRITFGFKKRGSK